MAVLYDVTRRWICRLLLVALGLVPTLGLVAWFLWTVSPWYAKHHAASLSQSLGAAVAFDELSHPGPFVTRYRGFTLVDVETGAQLAQATKVEVRRRGDIVKIDAHGVSADVEPARLWKTLDSLLTRRPAFGARDIQFTAHDVLIDVAQRRRLPRLDVRISDDRTPQSDQPSGPRADVIWQDPLRPVEPHPIVTLVRDRRISPPATFFVLWLEGAPVDCRLLPPSIDPVKWANPECQFEGKLWGHQTADGWSGRVVGGRFRGVDYGYLLAAHREQGFEGRGDLLLEQAQLKRGRLVTAHGTISAGPGVVAENLLARAATSLALEASPELATAARFDYEQFRVAFDIGPGGLALAGLCRTHHGSAILAYKDRPLLTANGLQTRPVEGLLRLLAPDDVPRVPATAATAGMLRLLPLSSEQINHRAAAEGNAPQRR